MKPSKIANLLGKINRTVENPSFPDLAKIEIDLLMQHIRELYEEIDTEENNYSRQTNVAEKTKPEIPERVNVFTKPVIHANDDILLTEQPEAIKVTEFIKKAMTVAPEEKPVIEKPVQKVQKKETPAVTSSINESIKSGGSLNEKLKTSSAVEMHKKLSTKPLKELIDLNKRFVLLSELFKGNAEAFTAAIAQIDTMPDYETAQAFINTQLVANYFWDETKQSTRMFTKLVKMKFGVE